MNEAFRIFLDIAAAALGLGVLSLVAAATYLLAIVVRGIILSSKINGG